MVSLVASLKDEAPRTGLGAATGHFVDHVAGVAERYGRNLFHCFDDDRIPSTTNGLEGFFGISKSQIRGALGTKSTTNGVAQNLGADYLVALAFVRSRPRSALLDAVGSSTAVDFREAREAIMAAEQPAILRRSRRRTPKRHLEELLARWLASQ